MYNYLFILIVCKIPLLTQKGNQQSSINGNSDIVPLENIPTVVEQNTAPEANSKECSDKVLMLDKDLTAEETGQFKQHVLHDL